MSSISIVVPVYNVEPYINRCVDSILAQSFADFELILVDDGSPDNCSAICDEYDQKDDRIVVIHKENGGLSDARNAGIDWAFSNSDSDWITFIDSDDWIHPRYLELLYRANYDNDCLISICNYFATERETIEDSYKNCTVDVYDPEDLYCNKSLNAIIAWGKLYSKDLFKNIRFPYGQIYEDEFTTYKVLFLTEKVAFINSPLYYYFKNSNSIMHQTWSEKCMLKFDALGNQVAFFKNRSLKNAFNKSIERFFWYAEYALNTVSKLRKPEKRKYSRDIRKRIKKVLGKYHNFLPFEKFDCYYEIVYGKFICRAYHRIRALKKTT